MGHDRLDSLGSLVWHFIAPIFKAPVVEKRCGGPFARRVPCNEPCKNLARDSCSRMFMECRGSVVGTTDCHFSLSGTGRHNVAALRRRVLYPLSYGRVVVRVLV